MGELVREIVASELERIGDERLDMVTITAADVDGALEHADVFYSSLSADEEGRSEEVAEALEELRWKVQQVVNRQVRARRTPQIRFRPDTVLSSALRIDQILRDIGEQGPDPADIDDDIDDDLADLADLDEGDEDDEDDEDDEST